MTVIQDTHTAGSRSHHISPDAVPRASCETIFLVQDGSCRKCRSRMPGREGVAGRTVRTLLTGSVLDTVHKQSHDSIGCCRTHSITSPRASSLHTGCLQAGCQQQRRILQIIVYRTVEIILELLSQASDIRPLSSQCGSGYDPGKSGKREVGAHARWLAVLPTTFRHTRSLCFLPYI